jgi:CRP/FNR family nitrogen fixation transcriptional regulator
MVTAKQQHGANAMSVSIVSSHTVSTPAALRGHAARKPGDFQPQAADGFMGLGMPFARNEEVFGEGEPAEYLYRVQKGCVRTYRILADGRRQIAAFYLPGDVFGLEAGERHVCSAEATVESVVALIKRRPLEQRAGVDHAIARRLFDMVSLELRRAQDHAVLLIKNAQERLAAFLLDLADREDNRSEVSLPMSRQDIADYLGLTIETVSRTLTQLEHAKAIGLPSSRRVQLRNLSALANMNN